MKDIFRKLGENVRLMSETIDILDIKKDKDGDKGRDKDNERERGRWGRRKKKKERNKRNEPEEGTRRVGPTIDRITIDRHFLSSISLAINLNVSLFLRTKSND